MQALPNIARLVGKMKHDPLGRDGVKWCHLMGIELELENVSKSDGSRFMMDDDYDEERYPYEDDDDWDDISDNERDERIERWLDSRRPAPLAGWALHSDSSLRNGIEFVTNPAVAGKDLEQRIDSFYNADLRYDGGPRTSTHIHINALDMEVSTLQSMVMLTYTVEDALYRLVDESRKWSGYSVALNDMSHSRLRNLLNPCTLIGLTRAVSTPQNRDRYYGLNFNVGRHGTVEFRYFPGAPVKQQLIEWVDLVVALKEAALKYSPDALASAMCDATSTAQFLRTALGYWGDRFVNTVGAEVLLNNFEEINSLRADGTNPERTNSVIKITPEFASYLSDMVLLGDKEALTYVEETGVFKTMLSFDDVQYYLTRAKGVSQEIRRGPTPSLYTHSTFANEIIRLNNLGALDDSRIEEPSIFEDMYRVTSHTITPSRSTR